MGKEERENSGEMVAGVERGAGAGNDGRASLAARHLVIMYRFVIIITRCCQPGEVHRATSTFSACLIHPSSLWLDSF